MPVLLEYRPGKTRGGWKIRSERKTGTSSTGGLTEEAIKTPALYFNSSEKPLLRTKSVT